MSTLRPAKSGPQVVTPPRPAWGSGQSRVPGGQQLRGQEADLPQPAWGSISPGLCTSALHEICLTQVQQYWLGSAQTHPGKPCPVNGKGSLAVDYTQSQQ